MTTSAQSDADVQAAKDLAASVQASRNAGCCVLLEDDDFKESLTPMDRIAYWGAVGLVVGMSVAVVFGTVGYVSVKACGL